MIYYLRDPLTGKWATSNSFLTDRFETVTRRYNSERSARSAARQLIAANKRVNSYWGPRGGKTYPEAYEIVGFELVERGTFGQVD